jgi:hypothetical protein
VSRLARKAYDERHLPDGTLDLARLPLFADALEDAGCTDAELLGTCAGRGSMCGGAGHWIWFWQSSE